MDWFLYDNGLRHEKVKKNTFFSVNDTLILVVVFHKTLPSRGTDQLM